MSRDGVNHRLTANRRGEAVENPEYAAFARRVLRAYGRRIAEGDVEGLPAMVDLARQLDADVQTAVDGLRAGGYTWEEIANRLQISRQAAQQRWGGRS